MKHALRGFIALGLLLAVLLAAYGSPAWASTQTEKTGVSQALDWESAAPGSTNKGTVKPPPSKIEACGPGYYPVGGAAVVKVLQLTDGYCVKGDLRGRYRTGRLPEGAGKFLQRVVSVRYLENGNFRNVLPTESGNVEVCFAVPPEKSVQVYFYNEGQDSWVPIYTGFVDGMACAPAVNSGYYGLVGQ